MAPLGHKRRRLTSHEVSRLLSLRAHGHTLACIATELRISEQAVVYWTRKRSMSGDGVATLRRIHKKNLQLNSEISRLRKMLNAAAFVVRMYEPSRNRRANLVPPIRARFDLLRCDANRIVGLRPSTGDIASIMHADSIVIAMMKDYLSYSPRSGFETIFKALLKGRPGRKHRALDLYRQYFRDRQYGRVDIQRRAPPVRHMKVQNRVNQVWSMDFMHALLPDGKTFWILNVIDDFNREVIISKAMKRHSAKAVIYCIQRLINSERVPEAIRTDNGGEFKSLAYKEFTDKNDIKRIYSRYRIPNDNAYIESFNNLVRNEVVKSFNYRTINQAQLALDGWCLRYNFVRPHGSLGGISPMQYGWLAEQKTGRSLRSTGSSLRTY